MSIASTRQQLFAQLKNPLGYSPVAERRPKLFLAQAKRFGARKLGYYFLTLPSAKGQPYGTSALWDGEQFYGDIPLESELTLDEMANAFLQEDPEAKFIIRFMPDAPKRWKTRHPDECFQNNTGAISDEVSRASTRYLQDVRTYSQCVVRYCESRPWANRIIGYWNGLSHEGTPSNLFGHQLIDHSPAMQASWEKFVGKDIPLPAEPLNTANPGEYWQPASSNQKLRQYFELQKVLLHKLCDTLLTTTRDTLGPNKLILVDAFKTNMQGWTNFGFFHPNFNHPSHYCEILAGAGHMDVGTLLDHPELDGVITPLDYQTRGIGGVTQPEGAVDSVVLRGKPFLAEWDVRTLAGDNPTMPARDANHFAAMTWRNVADALTRGYHGYYMDVYQDWFQAPEIIAIIDAQQQALQSVRDIPAGHQPGIAVFIDDRAALETNGDGAYPELAVMQGWRQGLAHCGVPFRIYLLSDLAQENFPEHRVAFFPNLFRYDVKTDAQIKQHFGHSGKSIVWGPGTGISNGDQLSSEGTSAYTGFDFHFEASNMPRWSRLIDYSHRLTQNLDAGTSWGDSLAYGPTLYPKNGYRLAEITAKIGGDRSGLSILSHGADSSEWHSIFSAALPLPANLWREIARHAEAHVYCEANENLLASANFVALHGIKPGTAKIELSGRRDYAELTDGGLSGDSNQISWKRSQTETRIFQLK